MTGLPGQCARPVHGRPGTRAAILSEGHGDPDPESPPVKSTTYSKVKSRPRRPPTSESIREAPGCNQAARSPRNRRRRGSDSEGPAADSTTSTDPGGIGPSPDRGLDGGHAATVSGRGQCRRHGIGARSRRARAGIGARSVRARCGPGPAGWLLQSAQPRDRRDGRGIPSHGGSAAAAGRHARYSGTSLSGLPRRAQGFDTSRLGRPKSLGSGGCHRETGGMQARAPGLSFSPISPPARWKCRKGRSALAGKAYDLVQTSGFKRCAS